MKFFSGAFQESLLKTFKQQGPRARSQTKGREKDQGNAETQNLIMEKGLGKEIITLGFFIVFSKLVSNTTCKFY